MNDYSDDFNSPHAQIIAAIKEIIAINPLRTDDLIDAVLSVVADFTESECETCERGLVIPGEEDEDDGDTDD